MEALIKKDIFTLQKKVFFLLLLWFIPLTNFFTDGSAFKHLLLLIFYGSTLILYSNFNTSSSEEMQSRLINSLPVTRKQIILSKYVAGCIWFALGSVLVTAYVILFHQFAPFPSRLIYPAEYIICLAIVYLFLAIFYPFLYAVGYKAASFLSVIVFVSILMFFQISINLSENPKYPAVKDFIDSLTQNQWIIAGFLSFLSLVLTIISYKIAVRVYEKKDF
ncbi:ABC-2 transporter permease [Metabacillus litoralis]|uniref:ABC-2 transporter permease n=1 Tax=Metabacillus litoralis TaxID=152268 RepID=UPI001CFF105F|nr:ABC-2 transporter permease [Metabacillus litoralis]